MLRLPFGNHQFSVRPPLHNPAAPVAFAGEGTYLPAALAMAVAAGAQSCRVPLMGTCPVRPLSRPLRRQPP
jgi:hypothetical protein